MQGRWSKKKCIIVKYYNYKGHFSRRIRNPCPAFLSRLGQSFHSPWRQFSNASEWSLLLYTGLCTVSSPWVWARPGNLFLINRTWPRWGNVTSEIRLSITLMFIWFVLPQYLSLPLSLFLDLLACLFLWSKLSHCELFYVNRPLSQRTEDRFGQHPATKQILLLSTWACSEPDPSWVKS